jgi:uncharacterized repeat protein (TIGR02543 family)
LDGQNYAFNADITLYAIWVAQASNRVTFDSNTATSGTTDSQTANTSTALRANGFSKTGYTFLKWNTAANGTGTSYLDGYVYSFAAPRTLYAIWGQNLTISYSGNTNTSGTPPVPQQYVKGGSDLNISGNTGSLTKTGYTLSGWNTAANGTGTSYALNATNGSFANNTTLYAQWIGATYSIVYVGNGNATGTSPNSQSYVSGGSTITIASNTGNLTKKWSLFNGWNTQADGSGASYAAALTNQTFSADTILYVNWLKTSLYGIEDSEITELQSWNASVSDVTTTVTNPANSSSFTVTIPGSSLPIGTTIKLWELANQNIAKNKIDSSKDYIVNLVLSWVKSDNTIPVASTPITLRISNSTIKQGAVAYQIIGNTVTQLGTANSDGVLSISLTNDPVITITNPAPQNSGGGSGNAVTQPAVDSSTAVTKPTEDTKPVQNKITTVTSKVYFGMNSAVINTSNLKLLKNFINETSKISKISSITIYGYTQPTRIDPNPEVLAAARAKAVAKVFKAQGIEVKIVAVSKGQAPVNNAKSRTALVTISTESLTR